MLRCGQYPNGQMAQWLLDMPGPLNNIAGCIWVAWRLWSELSAPPPPASPPTPPVLGSELFWSPPTCSQDRCLPRGLLLGPGLPLGPPLCGL